MQQELQKRKPLTVPRRSTRQSRWVMKVNRPSVGATHSGAVCSLGSDGRVPGTFEGGTGTPRKPVVNRSSRPCRLLCPQQSLTHLRPFSGPGLQIRTFSLGGRLGGPHCPTPHIPRATPHTTPAAHPRYLCAGPRQGTTMGQPRHLH